MSTTTTLLTTFAILLMIQVCTINSQTSSIQSLPNTMGILLSISASGTEVDDRTAEDIRTAYNSPSVSGLINSSTSSSLSQYFFDDTNQTSNSPIKMLQAINSLYVIKVMYDVANKIQSTVKSTVYWSKLTLMTIPMQRTLANFFAQASTTSPSTSSPFPEEETAPPTDAPSLIIFKFTPLVKEALNITPTFTLEDNPLLSNLTVDQSVSGATASLFALARLVSVTRQLTALINITSDQATLAMLNQNLRGFQRILYSINSLTEYKLVDQITEFDFLLISAPSVQLSSIPPAAKKRNNNNFNKKANSRKLKTRTIRN